MPTSPHTHTRHSWPRLRLAWPSYPRPAWRVLGGSRGGRRSCHPAPPGSSSIPPSAGAVGICSPQRLSLETALCLPSFDCLSRPPGKIRGRRVWKTVMDGGWSHHSRRLCPDVSPNGSPEGVVKGVGDQQPPEHLRQQAEMQSSTQRASHRLQQRSSELWAPVLETGTAFHYILPKSEHRGQ